MKKTYVVALVALAAASACGTAPLASAESCFPYENHLRVYAECRDNRRIGFDPLEYDNGEFGAFDVEQWLSTASPRTTADQLAGCSLRIACGEAVRVDAAYEETCRRNVALLVARLSERWAPALCPIDSMALRYKQGGGCYDTFIPGREAADCFEDLNASVVLRARDASECGSAPPAPVL